MYDPPRIERGSSYHVTKITVKSGACGFDVEVTAEKQEDRTVRITLAGECAMIRKMSEDLPGLDLRSLFIRHTENPVYRAAAKHLKHVACPVPAAVLKAAEVELGLNVAKDASIRFECAGSAAEKPDEP
ncbi:MAG: hypothetical protein OHK006_18070 [Thermodesulfovibrionales bacterium]